MEIQNIEDLKNAAIAIKTAILVHWPQSNENTLLQPITPDCRSKYTYNYNNGVTVFVDDAVMYVIPSMRIVTTLLQGMGYESNYNLYVPFSNGDYPVVEKAKWDSLLKMQDEQREKNFVADCEQYCDTHGIGNISEDLFEKCFEMPASGVHVKHFYYEDTLYPHISTFLDCVAVTKLGRYTTNNGTCVFVYRNGKTYVTRYYSVLAALRAAGYKEGSLFVPFSNGEVPTDPTVAGKWKRVANG